MRKPFRRLKTQYLAVVTGEAIQLGIPGGDIGKAGDVAKMGEAAKLGEVAKVAEGVSTESKVFRVFGGMQEQTAFLGPKAIPVA